MSRRVWYGAPIESWAVMASTWWLLRSLVELLRESPASWVLP
jgi:hypothetical protein